MISTKNEVVVNESDEHQYMNVADIRSCCNRITKFIRVCDLQFIQAPLECLRVSVKMFVSFFLSTRHQSCLSVNSIFAHFQPTPELFCSAVSKAWAELSDILPCLKDSCTRRRSQFTRRQAFRSSTRSGKSS